MWDQRLWKKVVIIEGIFILESMTEAVRIGVDCFVAELLAKTE